MVEIFIIIAEAQTTVVFWPSAMSRPSSFERICCERMCQLKISFSELQWRLEDDVFPSLLCCFLHHRKLRMIDMSIFLSWLRLLKKNRDLENEVMKDVPGWKTGTWYGEPVYFTLGDKWWDPSMDVSFSLLLCPYLFAAWTYPGSSRSVSLPPSHSPGKSDRLLLAGPVIRSAETACENSSCSYRAAHMLCDQLFLPL